jgi:hypothetical protein
MSRDDSPAPRPAAADRSGDPPGIPGFRTWRGVYLFVLGTFAATIALIAVFTEAFSP